MQKIVDGLYGIWNWVAGSFKTIFKFFADGLATILDGIKYYYEVFLIFFSNLANSFLNFFNDIPAFLVHSIFDSVVWLFNFLSSLCGVCQSTSTGSANAELQSVVNALGGDIIYLLQKTGFVESLSIMAAAVSAWGVFRLMNIILRVVT